MPDPMTKEQRAELRKLAEQFKAGLGYTVADMYMQMVSAPEMRLLLSGIEALDAAEAEAGRLREVAGKLPVTADGVPVTPGMKVFWVSEDPRSIAGIMVEYITDADAYWRDRGEEMGIPLEWAMSTEAAARAAQGTSDAGKGETK